MSVKHSQSDRYACVPQTAARDMPDGVDSASSDDAQLHACNDATIAAGDHKVAAAVPT